MARKRGIDDTDTGHSGQQAVMAELLFRRCNVARPEVDVGQDVFAFHDEREDVARIQVKTAQATAYKRQGGYSARFTITMKQLDRPDKPPLFYVLAVRLDNRWIDFVVISRTQLVELWNGDRPFGFDNLASGELELYVQFRPDSVRCGDVELREYRNAWGRLPPLRP
jgi:hypothetical protein